MSPGRRRTALLLTLALLPAAPGAAWAQGAGDDQYQDPFADAPAAPAPAATTPATPAEPASTPAPASGAVASSQLPRTGPDAIGVALAGATLALAGAGLRRGTRADRR